MDRENKGKRAKVDDDDASELDAELVQAIEKLQEVQDELERVCSLGFRFLAVSVRFFLGCRYNVGAFSLQLFYNQGLVFCAGWKSASVGDGGGLRIGLRASKF